MRILKLTVLAGAALAALACPAAAQWYGGYNAPPPPYGYGGPGRPLPRDIIVERIEERGFGDIGRPRFDGSVYVIDATSRRTGPVRLVVDAFDGRILRQSSLSVARLGSDEDDEWGELDAPATPRRRSGAVAPSPYDEMPNAPRYRPGEPEDAPRREAARPIEPDLIAPPSARTRPADPRLAPEGGAAARPTEPAEPRREAARPADPSANSSSSAPQGMNPDVRAVRPSARTGQDVAARPARPAAKPAEPAAKSSPSAPAAPVQPEAAKPAPAGPATAEADRKPVRVIQGVTPLNSGAQNSPAPLNNLAPTPPNAPAQPSAN